MGVLGAGVAILVLLAAGSVQAAPVAVHAMNYEFLPATVTISVGEDVRWTFAGETHTVTSGIPGAPDGRFDSGFKNPGESFEVTFDRPGTFRYFCQIHSEQMFGTIVVKAAATPKPTVRSTPRPTPRPTVKPTATRGPTPSPASTATQTALPSNSASPSPLAAETPGSSQALLETALTSNLPASSVPADVAPSSATDPAPVVALLVVLAMLVGGGLIVAQRRRVI
jgi:plastocyanin